MYLSKLVLNANHPQSRRDLSSAYEMHRTLSRAFAENADTPPARFLWRLERRGDFLPSSTVLVQAAVPGNWRELELFPGYANEILGNKEVDLFTLVQSGVRYRFRLLANPTVTRAGKRFGLSQEEDQLEWLRRQGERHGFAVHGCVRGATERLQVRQGSSSRRITLDAALFEGQLETTEAELLRRALLQGLGHGKALGLGMLSVARQG
jgi:CRISPR system Cascade subunit CasE